MRKGRKGGREGEKERGRGGREREREPQDLGGDSMRFKPYLPTQEMPGKSEF